MPTPSHPSPALPAAVLWDMDGTIVDSEPYWMAEEEALVAAAGGTWRHEDALELVGNDLLVSARIILERSPVTGTPEEEALARAVHAVYAVEPAEFVATRKEWVARLRPLSARGRWSRQEPFGRPQPQAWDGPVATPRRKVTRR